MNKPSSEGGNVPAPATRAIRTVVVEDSPVAMQALVHLLSFHPPVEVVGSARDGERGLTLVDRLQPDLVITDLNLPRSSGLQLAETLRRKSPTLRLIVTSTHHGAVWQNLSLTRGADAFVTKHRLDAELAGLLARFFPDRAPSPS